MNEIHMLNTGLTMINLRQVDLAPQPFSTEVLPEFANHVHARSELRDFNVHHELQAYLVKHI